MTWEVVSSFPFAYRSLDYRKMLVNIDQMFEKHIGRFEPIQAPRLGARHTLAPRPRPKPPSGPRGFPSPIATSPMGSLNTHWLPPKSSFFGGVRLKLTLCWVRHSWLFFGRVF